MSTLLHDLENWPTPESHETINYVELEARLVYEMNVWEMPEETRGRRPTGRTSRVVRRKRNLHTPDRQNWLQQRTNEEAKVKEEEKISIKHL